MGTLPEQVNSNLATLQRLQMEHQTVADNLRQATDTLLLLESGLTPTGAPAAAEGPPPVPPTRSRLCARSSSSDSPATPPSTPTSSR